MTPQPSWFAMVSLTFTTNKGSMEADNSRVEGLAKMKEIVDRIHTCMFITNNGGQNHVRPMVAIKVDINGDIWFFSEQHSEKVKDISSDNGIQLLFSHPGKDAYLDIRGVAQVETDKEKIQELWSPIVKAWFPKGEDDPDICLVKVEPQNVYYWDSGNNKMTHLLKTIPATTSTAKPYNNNNDALMR